MRNAVFVGIWLAVSGLAAPAPAHADAPPMPPCPPGWEQVDAFSCREPIKCPPGWKLDVGPVCVPWECQKASDCSWKGIIPCQDADVCAAGSGPAVRICDAGASGPSCPSGLTCQKRKLCAGFSSPAGRSSPRFENWTPEAKRSASSATAATSAPATAAAQPAEAAGASPAPTADRPAASPDAAVRRASCQYAAAATPGSLGQLALLLLAALGRRRRRSGVAESARTAADPALHRSVIA